MVSNQGGLVDVIPANVGIQRPPHVASPPGSTARRVAPGSPLSRMCANFGLGDGFGVINGLQSPPPLWGRLGRGVVRLGRSSQEMAALAATPHPGPPPQGGREFAAPAVLHSSTQSLRLS